MTESTFKWSKATGITLVFLMVVLQGIYAIYSFIDPSAFSALRGTELAAPGDADWVKIYASRTLFVALIIGYLLYKQSFQHLKWAAVFGLVMPITDAVLAYQAEAVAPVIIKHIATAVYLLVTFIVLHLITQYLSMNSSLKQGE